MMMSESQVGESQMLAKKQSKLLWLVMLMAMLKILCVLQVVKVFCLTN